MTESQARIVYYAGMIGGALYIILAFVGVALEAYQIDASFLTAPIVAGATMLAISYIIISVKYRR